MRCIESALALRCAVAPEALVVGEGETYESLIIINYVFVAAYKFSPPPLMFVMPQHISYPRLMLPLLLHSNVFNVLIVAFTRSSINV